MLKKPNINAKNQTLRALIVADHLGHSDGKVHGGTTYFLNIFPELIRQGVDLTVAFLGSNHQAANKLEDENIRLLFYNRSKWDPRALIDVFKLCKKLRPDIIHLHSVKSHILGRLSAFTLGIPSIVHLHDAQSLGVGFRSAQWLLSPVTSKAIIVSEVIRPFAISEYFLNNEIVEVVPNGLDLSPFSKEYDDRILSSIRNEFGIPLNAPLIMVAGRVNKVKGQFELIRIMPKILKTLPTAKLLVVGDGPNLSKCKDLSSELNIENAVHFAGQRNCIPEFLAASDIIVIPSIWEEPFGYVALEAIASGKPVVGFKSGMIPYLVEHGKNGLIVEKGDLKRMTSSILTILSDKNLCDQYGKNGRRHSQNFTVTKHVEQLIRIYKSVLN